MSFLCYQITLFNKNYSKLEKSCKLKHTVPQLCSCMSEFFHFTGTLFKSRQIRNAISKPMLFTSSKTYGKMLKCFIPTTRWLKYLFPFYMLMQLKKIAKFILCILLLTCTIQRWATFQLYFTKCITRNILLIGSSEGKPMSVCIFLHNWDE